MVVVMKERVSDGEVEAVISQLVELGMDVHRSTGAARVVLGVVGSGKVDPRLIELMPGVHEVLRITEPYKLASRTFKPDDTIINVGDVRIGGDEVIVIAGPCSAESDTQVNATAAAVKRAGAKILRGGAFKPRSSPYSFQGMGEEGLQLLRSAANSHDLKLVTEVMDASQIEVVDRYADMFQVGARNMQNFTLLRELGRTRRPILLKRGIAATVEEWLLSAEYVLSGGNTEVILCERGIRTFETSTRNTLDISAIPIVKQLSHLPVFVDPSHGTGRRDKVAPMARAAVAAGADGLIIEVHCDPDHALSDGAQSMFPAQFDRLMAELRIIAPGDWTQHLPRTGGATRMGPVDVARRSSGQDSSARSVVLAAKRKWPSIQTRTIDRAESLDVISKADLVVLATPVDATIDILPEVSQLVEPAALVIDTGSTKRAILQAAKAAGLKAFVGGHPMAGGTTPGPAEARANLFDNTPWFLMNPDAPRGSDGSRGQVRRSARRAVRFA